MWKILKKLFSQKESNKKITNINFSTNTSNRSKIEPKVLQINNTTSSPSSLNAIKSATTDTNKMDPSVIATTSATTLETEKIQNCVVTYLGEKTILIWDRIALKAFNSLPFINFVKDKSNGIQRIVVMNCNYNVSVEKFLEDVGKVEDNLFTILQNILQDTVVRSIKAQSSSNPIEAGNENATANTATSSSAAAALNNVYSLTDLALAETNATIPSTTLKSSSPPTQGIIVIGIQLPGCSLGDYSHLHDILPTLFEKFHNCEFHVFIGIDYQHPHLQLLYEKIKRDFLDRKIECVVFTIFYTDEYGTYSANQEITNYAEKLIQSDRCIVTISVSYPCKEVSFGCIKQRKTEIRIYAHAMPLVTDQFPIININMGLDLGRFGVKFPNIIVNDSIDARTNVLVTIGQYEPEFFKLLTRKAYNTTDPAANFAAAKLYLETHHYLFGYVQGNNDVLLFMVSHLLKFMRRNNAVDKPCDFHLPKITPELINLIKLAVIKYGISAETIEFIDQANPQASFIDEQLITTSRKIRVFTYKIGDDEIWKLLYQLSKDGVGASGDNTVEQAYGSRSIPLIITLEGDRKCWINNIKNIAQTLSLPTTALVDYFDFIVKYANKSRNYNAELPYYSEGLSIYDVAERAAEFLRNPSIQKEWESLQKELTSNGKYDFYHNLSLLLHAITPSSSYDDYLAAKNSVLASNHQTE